MRIVPVLRNIPAPFISSFARNLYEVNILFSSQSHLRFFSVSCSKLVDLMRRIDKIYLMDTMKDFFFYKS